MAFPSFDKVWTASALIAVGTALIRRRALAREAGSTSGDHMIVRRQRAAVQRVVHVMVISRLLRTCGKKLLAMRSASREAAAREAAARDVAQKQMLMQQLAKTLMAGREKGRK